MILRLCCSRFSAVSSRAICRRLSTDTSAKDIYELTLKQARIRKALSTTTFGSPTARKFKVELAAISQSIADIMSKRKQTVFEAPSLVSLEVLSNGMTHCNPFVVVRTPDECYLFNCPEGASRFLPSMRVRPNSIQNFFITRGNWDCIGGLIGVMFNKEVGAPVSRLHGPRKIQKFLESVRPMIDSDHGTITCAFHVEERPYDCGVYENSAVRVHYIPLFPMSTSLNQSQIVDVAYLMELKPPVRKIDILKLARLKVPKGPLIGKLKAGETITLPDGTTVTPSQVYDEKEQQDFASNILVVDCENIEKIQSLESNSLLEKYVEGTRQMGYVVHYTKNSVLMNSQYQKWMQSFGKNCYHLIVNGTGTAVPLVDGPYVQQNMLKEIAPELFPDLYPFAFRGEVNQDIELLPGESNVLTVSPFKKLPMRGNFATNDAIQITIEQSELEERILQTPAISEAIKIFNERVSSSKLDCADHFPVVSFTGTSSAAPSKYRNVSSYFFELSATVSVLIDCGEGTFGQLKVLHGPDRIDDILLNIRAVFITHAHLDHFGGIYTIISERVRAYARKGIPYKKLIFVCNRNTRRPITLYTASFSDLEKYLHFVDITSFVHDVNAVSDSERKRLVIETTEHFPPELFSQSEWNLKRVKAVHVHHTRMSNGFVFDTLDGKRYVFSGDTMPCDLLAAEGLNADLLIHEATFDDAFEIDALRKKHSTTGQAIGIAEKMKAKYTILTHFSGRYPRIPDLSERLMATQNIGVAMDNMVVPYNKRHIPPALLPVYKILFETEQFEYSLKKMQRALAYEERAKAKLSEQKQKLEDDNEIPAPRKRQNRNVP